MKRCRHHRIMACIAVTSKSIMSLAAIDTPVSFESSGFIAVWSRRCPQRGQIKACGEYGRPCVGIYTVSPVRTASLQVPYLFTMPDVKEDPQEDAIASPTTTDPYASRVVTHTQYGIWDVYQEVSPDAGTMAVWPWLEEKVGEAMYGLPELACAFKDVLAIPGCKVLISIYTTAELVASFMPAMAIGCGILQLFSPQFPHVFPTQVSGTVPPGREHRIP